MRLLDWTPARKLVMWAGPKVMPARYFEWLYAQKPDPWACATRDYELRKYERTLAAIKREWTKNVLELGCGEGVFSRMLSPRATSLLGIDVSESALERARDRCSDRPNVAFARIDVVKEPLPSGFTLIVAAEVLYYFGGGRTYARVCKKLVDALEPGGHIVSVSGSPDATSLNDALVRAGARLVKQTHHPDPVRPFTIGILEK